MKVVYKRENFIISEFDTEDVINTSIPFSGSGSGSGSGSSSESGSGSGSGSGDTTNDFERENAYREFYAVDIKPLSGSWF